MALLAVLLLLSAAPTGSAARLDKETSELHAAMIAKCPKQRSVIEQLDGASPAQRVESLKPLEACAAANPEAYFITLGNESVMASKWADAEVAFHKALAIRVTESAQVGLLTALVRQSPLSAAQKKDLDSNLEYFHQHACRRDDLCAGLSYVAWHADDYELAKRAGERAIALGFAGWQPYFSAGTVMAGGSSDAERARAVELLREAKNRGGPQAAIDGFLARLGVDAGPATVNKAGP
jgi:hypothetical protein